MLILTYHAVEPGRRSLFVDPGLLQAQLDELVDCGRQTLTVSGVATMLHTHTPTPPSGVVLTFDDGFASVAERAAPMLIERKMRATIFCVAGFVGGVNDWPSQHRNVPRRALADAAHLRDLAGAGFEIGAHGLTHDPLRRATTIELRRELLDSQSILEEIVQTPVRSFAYPYGERPSAAGRALLERAYDAACTTSIGNVAPDSDPYELPRVDVHYLQRPAALGAGVAGSRRSYLRVRGVSAQARRLAVPDYAGPPRSAA